MIYNLKTIIAIHNQLASYDRNEDVFTVFLDYLLAAFDWVNKSQKLEDSYQRLNHPKKAELLRDMMIELGNLSDRNGAGYGDPLGEMYMHLSLVNKKIGQIFTPEEVSSLLAMLASGTEKRSQQTTVYDPAVGSGRMLLAAAKIDRNQFFYGSDIDLVCCKMTAINMLMNSLKGEIAHMDSLNGNFLSAYRIDTVLINGYYMPCYSHFTDPAISVIMKSYNFGKDESSAKEEKITSTRKTRSKKSSPKNGLLF